MADRIWIWFAENGNIRKWDAKPFDEGTEYIVAAHADAELEEMTRSCLAERKASAEKDARIAELEAAVAVQRESKEYAQRCCITAESALTASRAECEGLRAALKQITEIVPSSNCDAGSMARSRMKDIALLALRRAALSQKETGNAT